LELISIVYHVLPIASCARFPAALSVQLDLSCLLLPLAISVQIYFKIVLFAQFILPAYHAKTAQKFFSSQALSAKVVKNFTPTALLVKKHLTVLIYFAVNAFIHLFLTLQEFNASLVLKRFKIASNVFMIQFSLNPNVLCACQNLK
jgi:hypothetical protein